MFQSLIEYKTSIKRRQFSSDMFCSQGIELWSTYYLFSAVPTVNYDILRIKAIGYSFLSFLNAKDKCVLKSHNNAENEGYNFESLDTMCAY
jgi:hypothetical protein